MNKPLVIYHASCTDGFGAAYCAWLKFGDEAEYFPAHYGICNTVDKIDNLPNLSKRDVYVLDFSFSPEVTACITDLCENFIWLDHHKTAFDSWCGESYLKERFTHYLFYSPQRYILLDNNRSGCKLAWDYFCATNPDEVPQWVKWIDDRDRWQFKQLLSKEFHAGMSMLKPWSFEQWRVLLDNVNVVVDKGTTVLQAYKQQVDSIVRHSRKVSILTEKNPVTGMPCENSLVKWDCPGLAINTSTHMSEVGHELATESGTFGLVWYLGEGDQAKVSLRSKGDYDVSAIAKVFGGGGHKNAAGFSVPITTLLGWLK